MHVEFESAKEAIRKLRKSLKQITKDPTAAEVHALRTETRRVEAVVESLTLQQEKGARRLLKLIAPVRKAAGKVRDMDVLISHAMTLSRGGDPDSDSLVRLVEYLGERRMKRARALVRTVRAKPNDAREELKLYLKIAREWLNNESGGKAGESSVASELVKELRGWPALQEENIHEFRIKVKELRYMLQLSGSTDEDLLDALGRVKDQIGEWHDWQELATIAAKVLDAERDREIIVKLEQIGKGKLAESMAGANDMRKNHLAKGSRSAKRRRSSAFPTHQPQRRERSK